MAAERERAKLATVAVLPGGDAEREQELIGQVATEGYAGGQILAHLAERLFGDVLERSEKGAKRSDPLIKSEFRWWPIPGLVYLFTICYSYPRMIAGCRRL